MTLRRLAQGSRAACLAMGARGLLRAFKGLLGLGLGGLPSSVAAAAAAGTDSSGDDENDEENGSAAEQQRELLLLEALRLWRVALRHGADLESLLDALALLSSTTAQSPPSPAAADGVGDDDVATEGSDGLVVLPQHWPPAAHAAWHRALEQACATAASAVRWQRGQEEEAKAGGGGGGGNEGVSPPPFPATALAQATLAECCGRLGALALGAWQVEVEEAEQMRADLEDLGAFGVLCCGICNHMGV